MLRFRCLGVVVLGLTMAFLVLADGPADPLPDADMTRLIDTEIKFIQEALAKGKADRKTTNKVKMSALLIAHYAQSGMNKDNAKQMATLRDQALKVIKAVSDEPAAAKKLADSLSTKIAADPSAKTDKVSLTPHLEVGLVMRVFSSKTIGGFGIERDLDDMAGMKGNVADADKQRIGDFARKLLLIATLAHDHYTPEADEGGGKTKKNWQTFATGFRDAAHGMVQSVKNNGDIGVAANNVMNSCQKCHDVFRKQ
jgi:hypothetical protein